MRRSKRRRTALSSDQGKFVAAQTAYDTLKDPDKRAHYDRTGDSAQAESNPLADIANLVIGALDRAVIGCGGKFERTDIIAAMIKLLQGDKRTGEQANEQLRGERVKFENMRKRLGFTGEQGMNLLDTALINRIRDSEKQERGNNDLLARLDATIEHVQLYGWEVDPEPVKPDVGQWADPEMVKAMFDEQFKRERYRGPRRSINGFPFNTGA